MKRLTKSQYEAIARSVWATLYMHGTIDNLAYKLADLFAEYDTEFDRQKFIDLCGLNEQ